MHPGAFARRAADAHDSIVASLTTITDNMGDPVLRAKLDEIQLTQGPDANIKRLKQQEFLAAYLVHLAETLEFVEDEEEDSADPAADPATPVVKKRRARRGT